MMKNRAGWLALLVLVIATILMVFFVLPRISKNQPAEQPEQAAQTPAENSAATNTNEEDELKGKVRRLVADAGTAVKGLSGLFTDGNLPTAEAYAGARAVAETAVTAVTEIDVPATIESATATAMNSAKASATNALNILRSLPDEPGKAAPLIGNIEKALSGEAVEAAVGQPDTDAATRAPAEIYPQFDVLRVEPDGSAVIAGTAAANSTIEVIDGDSVIAGDKAGPSGDFVAITDDPLPPGDYALSLRATSEDGRVVMSQQVATVSVPKDSSGELLAMITTPGEASDVVAMPGTDSSKKPRVAASETTAPAENAQTDAAQTDAAQAETAQAETAPIEPAPTQTPETEVTAESSEVSEAAQPEKTAAAPQKDDQVIRVTAVEIEDDKIFIAGSTKTGGTVRGYADDALVGDARADAGGNFVIQGTAELSVGSHTIRVDLINESGDVVVRASVPFNRPEGSQVAVVAKAPSAANSGNQGDLVPLEQGAFEKLRDGLSKSFAILRSLYAEAATPTTEALAAARSATGFSLKSLSEFRPTDETSDAIAKGMINTAKAATEAATFLQSLPNDVDAVGKALPQLAKMIENVMSAAPRATAVQPEEAPLAAADQPKDPSAETAQTMASNEPTTIEQEPLTENRNAVIIRRGDTLWEISRRIYGQGVRYTTIYLANEDQIKNPDLIEPGQIFSVPRDALPDSEELHRKRMHGETIR